MIKTEKLSKQVFNNISGEYVEQVGERFKNAILNRVLFRAETDLHDNPISKKLSTFT